MRQMWLTAIGKDRPGIVARIARVLVGHGLNIEDSSMRILGGRFTMMLLLRGEAREDTLYKELLEAGRELGLDYIYVHPIADTDTETPRSTHIASLYGADRPGQVAAVAERLAEIGANIVGLETHVEGTASVQQVELVVPEDVDLDEHLREVAAERGIGVEIREL